MKTHQRIDERSIAMAKAIVGRIDRDPARAIFQLAAVAPLGPADQQRILATEEPLAFLALLERMVVEELEVLEARLSGG